MGGKTFTSNDYNEIDGLKDLKDVIGLRIEGHTKYVDEVKNKRKPKWLVSQVATHGLSGYWIFWIDANITEE